MKFLWNKKEPKLAQVVVNRNDIPKQNGQALKLHCRAALLSETGPTRSANEDAAVTFYPYDNYESVFAMVADGMGGHNAGEVASSMACQAAKRIVRTTGSKLNSQLLVEVTKKANEEIYHTAQSNPEYSGMGTTSVMLLIDQNKLYHAHVGDSRLYRLRQRSIHQLTEDHTLVNQMVQNGEITDEQAEGHSMKNVITRALGTLAEVEPDVNNAGIDVLPGDRYLLCSDGLYEVLSSQDLQSLLQLDDLDLLMDCLRSLGTTRKCSDNFSAIIIDVLHDDLSLSPSITKEQNVLL
jgi:protein phosphatase